VFVFAWTYHFSEMHSDFAAAKFVQFAGIRLFVFIVRVSRMCNNTKDVETGVDNTLRVSLDFATLR
jgi:hypothetical protein